MAQIVEHLSHLQKICFIILIISSNLKPIHYKHKHLWVLTATAEIAPFFLTTDHLSPQATAVSEKSTTLLPNTGPSLLPNSITINITTWRQPSTVSKSICSSILKIYKPYICAQLVIFTSRSLKMPFQNWMNIYHIVSQLQKFENWSFKRRFLLWATFFCYYRLLTTK